MIDANIIALVHEKSENNQSDLMTKPLKRVIHDRLTKLVTNESGNLLKARTT